MYSPTQNAKHPHKEGVFVCAAGGNRTLIPIKGQHFKCCVYTSSTTATFKFSYNGGPGAELNRRGRFCRPLPDHSATGPV